MFHAYQLQDGTYVKLWSKDLKQHFTPYDCRIAVTDSGEVLLQEDEYSPTLVFDSSGRHVNTWTHEGRLIGCLPPSRLVYAQERREDKRWEAVVVDEKHSTENTLPHTWGRNGYLSVCQNDGRIAITASYDRTLSIFSSQGNIPLPHGLLTTSFN